MRFNIALIGNEKNPFIYNLYKYLQKKNINVHKIFLEKKKVFFKRYEDF